MTTTPKLGLQLLVQNDANNVDVLNLNLEKLDVFANLVLESITITAQPTAPAIGDAYYIPSGGGTGSAWSGQADVIAYFVDAGEDPDTWLFLPMFEGASAYVTDVGGRRTYSGGSWGTELSVSYVNVVHPESPVASAADDRYALFYANNNVTFSEFLITNGPAGTNAPTDKALCEVGYSLTLTSASTTLVIDDTETDNGVGVLSGWDDPDTTINLAGSPAFQPSAITIPAGNWCWYRIKSVAGTVPVMTLHCKFSQ